MCGRLQVGNGFLQMREILRSIPGFIPAARAARNILSGRNFTPTYNEDCLITNHWIPTDAKFDAAYSHAVDLGLAVDPNIRWRAHTICWAAKIGVKLDGAFVECGVNRGFLSRIIVDYLEHTPQFYLLDTYKGFDENTLSQQQIEGLRRAHKSRGSVGDWRQGMYVECYDAVVKTFSDKPQVKIIRGTVPNTLPLVTEDKIAFLSLDMNCAAPEIAAIKYFWPKMSKGAVVVLDDYGHIGHDEQRHAFDDWSSSNNVPLLSLPTGQGLIIRP